MRWYQSDSQHSTAACRSLSTVNQSPGGISLSYHSDTQSECMHEEFFLIRTKWFQNSNKKIRITYIHSSNITQYISIRESQRNSQRSKAACVHCNVLHVYLHLFYLQQSHKKQITPPCGTVSYSGTLSSQISIDLLLSGDAHHQITATQILCLLSSIEKDS